MLRTDGSALRRTLDACTVLFGVGALALLLVEFGFPFVPGQQRFVIIAVRTVLWIVVGLQTMRAIIAADWRARTEVLAIDIRKDKVDFVKDDVSHAVFADATQRETLEKLPLSDMDAVIVAIGEGFAGAVRPGGANPRFLERLTGRERRGCMQAMFACHPACRGCPSRDFIARRAGCAT